MKADNRKSGGIKTIKISTTEKYKTIPSPDKDEIQIPSTSNRVQIESEPAVQDDKFIDLERRVQSMKIECKENNIKIARDNEDSLNEITNVLNKLDVKDEVKEEGESDEEAEKNDRIPRGPERLARIPLQTTTPYSVKSAPNRLHQCGGQVVENHNLQFGNFSTNGFTQHFTPVQNNLSPELSSLVNQFPTTLGYQHTQQAYQQQPNVQDCMPSYTIKAPLAYASPQSTFSSPQSYDPESSLSSVESSDPTEVVNLSASDYGILVDLVSSALKGDNTIEEPSSMYNAYSPGSTYSISSTEGVVDGVTGVNIPYPGEPSPYSISSGYDSGTSTPSNSPGPNNSNSPPHPSMLATYLPVTVEQMSTNVKPQRKFQAILPKPTLTYTMQERFYKYLLNLEKEAVIKRIIYIARSNKLETLMTEDKDGDTALIKLAINPKAVNLLGEGSSSDFIARLTHNPLVVRLACIYAIVERLSAENPKALNHKNKNNQSALHLAATNTPEYPIIAAYLAETMQRHGVELNERCQADGCEKYGTLLHCIARFGDSHANVMAQLLELPKAFMVDAKDLASETPLQVAIKRHRIGGDVASKDFRVHKMVETLIKHGASLSVKSKDSTTFEATPLQMVLDGPSEPDMDLLEVLLKTRVKDNAVNTPDNRKMQPLHYVATNLRLNYLSLDTTAAVMRLLVKYGAIAKQDIKTMLSNDHKEVILPILFPQLQHQQLAM